MLAIQARLILSLSCFTSLVTLVVSVIVFLTAWEHNERTRTAIAHRQGHVVLHNAFTGGVLVMVV
jgi:CHASE3 domain sensor protein